LERVDSEFIGIESCWDTISSVSILILVQWFDKQKDMELLSTYQYIFLSISSSHEMIISVLCLVNTFLNIPSAK